MGAAPAFAADAVVVGPVAAVGAPGKGAVDVGGMAGAAFGVAHEAWLRCQGAGAIQRREQGSHSEAPAGWGRRQQEWQRPSQSISSRRSETVTRQGSTVNC